MNLFSTPKSLLAGGDAHLTQRHREGRVWKTVFLAAILTGLIALAVLLLSILNQAVGLAAVEYKKAPEMLAAQPLTELDSAQLIAVLQGNLSANRVRALNREQALDQRSRSDLYALVVREVVQPTVVATWHLDQSVLQRAAITAEVANRYPGAHLEFRAWLNAPFLENTMSRRPEDAGIRTALLGSLLLIAITIAIAFPLGVGAAIYLEEYADKRRWINRVIQTNIDNLAGVPSIVYGILGLALFVRALEPITSGRLFGVEGGNGRTILSAALTMALLILPVLIINAQEAIRAVPGSLRQASYGLGATRWQTIWFHVLPYALPGILTGTILAVSRAIGETAPLIVVGASTYITSDPNGLFSNFTVLPIQIYNWTTRPQDTFRAVAAAAILVLLVLLLSLNAVAILLRNRLSRRY